jgi:hypothetical protein
VTQQRWDILPNDIKVAVMIERLEKEGNLPYFSKLLEVTGLKRSEMHNAIDNLIDGGGIDARWEKVNYKSDVMWARVFFLKSPMNTFVKKVSEELGF